MARRAVRNFVDVGLGARQSLPSVGFNPNSRARIADCSAGTFAQHPSCWNFADFRRRVWGLGVRRDSRTGEVRLYYSIWGSQGFGDPTWFTAGDDQRNSLWSVRIAPDGAFDLADVRREFLLPNFFSDPAQIISLGASHPVSAIAFPNLGEQTVMLVAERGGVRNLGLDATVPFARPHEARVLRYELDARGVWQPAGRYDVGYYDRKSDGQPYLRANAAGGVDFGFGYSTTGQVEQAQSDQFVWITGDRLCSPDAPCSDSPLGGPADTAEIHGLQGTPVIRHNEVAPGTALQPYPARGYAAPADTSRASFMIDIDATGASVVGKIARNAATKIGGVKVFAPAPAAPPQRIALPSRDAPAAPSMGDGPVPGPGAVPGVPPPQPQPSPQPQPQPSLPSPGGFGQWGGPGTTPPSPGGFGQWGGPGATYDLAIDKGPPHAGQAGAPGAGALHVCTAAQPCPFTVTITNTGNAKFDGPFRFTDTMPAGWSYAGASAGWSCAAAAGNTFSCTRNLSLEPGQSISVELKLNPMGGVPLQPVPAENCAEIDWSFTKKGGDKGKARACSPAILVPGAAPKIGEVDPLKFPDPDITVRKKGTATCQPGEQCDFVITIEGTDVTRPFTGPFNVTDIPPAGWTFAGGDKLGLWTCKSEGGACTYDVAKNPDLNSLWGDQPYGIGIGFNVPADQKDGTVKNCVIVTFPPPATGEISRSAKTACAFVEIGQAPKLTISKTFDKTVCSPGEECNFTITVKNEGKGPYTGLLTVWDFSASTTELKVDSVSAQGWNCHIQLPHDTSFFTCTKFSLAAGEMATFAAKARIVKDVQVGSIENCGAAILRGTNVGDLDYENRLGLAREALEHNGYKTSGGGPWTDTDKKALADYKKNNPIFTDAQGNIDTSGDITDQFLKTLLPRVADASGKQAIEACSTINIPPQLVIQKTGLSPTDYLTAAGKTCQIDHKCTFTIKVSGKSAAPYTKPIVIRDELPSGWKMTGYEPKGAGQWQCTGSNPVHCAHPAADLTQGKSLTLTIQMEPTTKFYQEQAAAGVRHPWIHNCSYIEVEGHQFGDNKDYESCYRVRVSLDFANFDFDPIGTGSCTPPNCTFYEFTATLRDAPYKGPLSIRIAPPRESIFPNARITKSGRSCTASGWLCTRDGAGFICRHSNCVLAEGEQVAARIDGRIAPELTEPPPVEMRKQTCAVLEWQVRVPEGIEQLGGKRTKQACATTRILAKPPVLPIPAVPGLVCTGGKVPIGNRCVCPANMIEMRGRCVACTAGMVPAGNRCVCPGNTIERRGVCVQPPRPAPAPVQPKPLQPQLLCLGGKVAVGNRCVCPANTIEMRGRCVPRQASPPPPRPATPYQTRPQFAPAPFTIACPAGSVWNARYQRCTPVLR